AVVFAGVHDEGVGILLEVILHDLLHEVGVADAHLHAVGVLLAGGPALAVLAQRKILGVGRTVFIPPLGEGVAIGKIPALAHAHAALPDRLVALALGKLGVGELHGLRHVAAR